MVQKDRLRRPDPGRTKPIRSNHLGNPGSPRAGPDAGKARQGPAARASVNDVVGHTVDLGYKVVEEHIRQGRRAAEHIRSGAYSAGHAQEDVKNLIGRVLKVSKELGVVWFDLLSAALGDARLLSALAGTDAAAETNVAIEVRSSRPTQVTLDLRPPSARFAPSVPSLRAADDKIRPLTGIRFKVGADKAPVLVVDVPEGQAPGTYTGAVVDSHTHEPGGTLVVRILS